MSVEVNSHWMNSFCRISLFVASVKLGMVT